MVKCTISILLILISFTCNAQWIQSDQTIVTPSSNIIFNNNNSVVSTIWLNNPSCGPQTGSGDYYIKSYDYWGATLHFTGTGDNNNEQLNVTFDGNVGIGTVTPGNKLEVIGCIKSSQLKIDYPNVTTNWDNEWQSGFFDAYYISSSPETTPNWFWGINIGHRSNNPDYRYGGQLLIKHSPNEPTLYFRSRGQDGKGMWAKVINSVGNQQINGNLFIRNATAETGFGKGANFVVSNNNTSSFGRHTSLIFAIDDLGTTPLSGISGVYDTWTSTNGAGMRMSFFTKDAASEILPTEKMTITGTGNIGIGTTSPSNKLEVNGTIRAKEIKVEAANWPDYVFADDYPLKELSEVEQYIDANKHLPDVPSAETMDQQGVNLGEMNRILLKKVEELTLYCINQNKTMAENEKLMAQKDLEMQQVKSEIDSLKKQLEELLKITKH